MSYWQNKVSPNIKQRRFRQPPPCGDKSKPCEVLVENGTKTEHKLKGLLPYKTYTMLLRAHNRGGDGPNSDPHHVKPTSFGKYVRMQWRSPREPNGVVTGYVAEVEGVEKVKLDASKMEYLFRGLKPEHEYVFSIKAKTSAGPGETVIRLVNTTAIRGIFSFVPRTGFDL